jgi:Flp pilus assembly protein TadG
MPTLTSRPLSQTRHSAVSGHVIVGRKGATTVEFAIVAPVFLLLIFGIFEFGRVFMVTQLLTEAARKSARVAIVEGTTSDQIKAAATNSLSIVGIKSESIGISVNDAPLDTVDPRNFPAFTEITVVVSVPASKVSWLPATVFVTGTLSGQFSMRRQ